LPVRHGLRPSVIRQQRILRYLA